MEIKDKLADQDKQLLSNLAIQRAVLGKLLLQTNSALEKKAKEILARNGLSPELYVLKFDPQQDLWEAELKEGALVIPNRETRRAIERRN